MTMTPPEMPNNVTNLPESIYLCLGLDGEPYDFDDLAEVHWCVDQIDDADPKYIREDIAQARAESLEALLKRARPILWEVDCCDLCEEIDQALGGGGAAVQENG